MTSDRTRGNVTRPLTFRGLAPFVWFCSMSRVWGDLHRTEPDLPDVVSWDAVADACDEEEE